MSLTPKPKYCHQNWDAMTQTEKGRICGACDKLIFDFRKNTWNEIEKKQRESNNTTCGLYSDKQLKYWGQEPPVLDIEIKKSFIITSLFLSLLGFIASVFSIFSARSPRVNPGLNGAACAIRFSINSPASTSGNPGMS